MSLADCIDTAVAGGEMDAALGEKAKAMFERLARDHARRMSGPAAEAAAADQTLTALRFELAQKHRRERLQLLSQSNLADNITGYRNRKGEADEGGGLVAHLGQSVSGANIANIENRRAAVRGAAHAHMDDYLASQRRTATGGARGENTTRDLVREAFGQDTGNADAKQFLKGWSQAAEYLRKRFNAAGGSIAKLEDWGLPQIHDTLKVRGVSFEQWRDAILPRLDVGAMRSAQTGLPLDAGELPDALRFAYDSITNEGWNKITPSGQGGGKAMASRYTDHRFLKFKSGDDWLAYQQQFGEANPFDAMMGYVDRMSRDIAMMEVLGPNPAATMRWADQFVKKRAAARDAKEGGSLHSRRADNRLKEARNLYDMHMNTSLSPHNATFAAYASGLRHFLTAAQLGAAWFSSLSDLGLQRLTSKYAGIPQWRSVGRTLKLFNPANLEDQKLAVRLGLIADGWLGVSHATARFMGEVNGPQIARRFSEAVMRLGGLNSWTQAGRWAFGMEFMGALADFSGKTFGDLHPDFRRTLQRYGFDAAAWDTIRQTGHFTDRGAAFLRPLDIADGRLGTRVAEMIQAETEFAVPSGLMRARNLILGESRPGSIGGELLRSAAMYKMFAVTMNYTHGMRFLNEKSLSGKASYAAAMLTSMTVMGGLALQLKEIAKGRDPRSAFDKDDRPSLKFVGAAILQGGGLGIFGDLLFSDLNRFGGGLAVTAAGPVAQFVDDTLNLTLGNVVQAAQGDKTNAGAELVRFLRAYTPGGSLWYARAGFERVVLDSIQRQVDPDAAKRWRRLEKRWQRDFGQEYWWRPGHTAPARAPNPAAAIGG